MSYTKGALLPAAPNTVRGQSTKLGCDPKGERIIYCNSRSVFLLSVSGQQPNLCYSGHPKDTTVAQISPSGFYAASADVSGTVKVWDLAGEDMVQKSEVKALGGRINALAWDMESKRIVVGGEGRDRFAHAFMFDSGSSVGELSGHAKIVNAVAVRQQRPFRCVTGGDDRTLVFSHGVPYKYAKTLTEHTGFVQDVAYAPSGDHFASVGSDGKLLLYDGSTGDFVADFSTSGQDSHKGSIFAVSWSKDSKQLSTSGADRTVKIWDVATKTVVQTWTLGGGVEHQQVGNVWLPNAAGDIASVSLSGQLNILDKREPNRPTKVIHGHQKAIGALSNKSPAQPTFFSGSYDGRIHQVDFSSERGEMRLPSGSGHTNAVVAIATSDRGKTYSVGMDDTMRELTSEEGFTAMTASLGSQPSALSVDPQGLQYVTTAEEVQVVQDGRKQNALKTSYKPQSVAVSSQGLLAVGGSDGKVYLYAAATLQPHSTPTLDKNRGTISALAFSPDGQYLAAGDSNGKIIVYSMPTGDLKTAGWVFHTAKITSISWAPNSTHAVSGSLDTNVYIWNIIKPIKNIAIKGAHAGGVAGVAFLDDNTAVSAGADAAVKTWKIKHHAV